MCAGILCRRRQVCIFSLDGPQGADFVSIKLRHSMLGHARPVECTQAARRDHRAAGRSIGPPWEVTTQIKGTGHQSLP